MNSLALLTDLYELTMAYGHWKTGDTDREAAFHLTFRKTPFKGGFAVAAGLADAIEFLKRFRFTPNDLAYLATLTASDGSLLFERAFLDYLRTVRLTCDVDAVPEGTVVFAHEPLVRVCGPIVQAQLLESLLLNTINFQTLIATKAARVCLAARGEPVVEFGLRRAQGADGALSASRAAFIGGCEATSNVLAGKRLGIPLRGTQAHSWVMCFETEREAFQAYAEAMPHNCVFLVDTYDSLEGVRHAVEMGRWLRTRGHKLLGIRLDSGDLAGLSIKARKILDAAGFQQTSIMATNELDEHTIESLKLQGAQIGVWGVGTKLVTGWDDPALAGVYKLSAIRNRGGPWLRRLKLSEDAAKTSTPGLLQVRRFHSGAEFLADAVYDIKRGVPEDCVIVNLQDSTQRKRLPPGTPYEDLLVPVFRHGKAVYVSPALSEMRERTQRQLASFHSGIKRSVNPHTYPVGLELGLHELKTALIEQKRQTAHKGYSEP